MIRSNTIAKIVIKNNYFTKDNLATISLADHEGESGFIYESICLENFPSFNDFIGYRTIVKNEDLCMIIKKIGRPFKINDHPNNSIYDVYEILFKNKLYHIFKQNLLEISFD
jgi:hypothetical protein